MPSRVRNRGRGWGGWGGVLLSSLDPSEGLAAHDYLVTMKLIFWPEIIPKNRDPKDGP